MPKKSRQSVDQEPPSCPETHVEPAEPPATSAGHAACDRRPLVLVPHKRGETIKESPHSSSFRARRYPGVSAEEWGDWRWQIANRITGPDGLARVLDLTGEELAGLALLSGRLPMSVTPYYASLLEGTSPADPLRRCVVPTESELDLAPGESDDPLGEDAHSPVEGLVHRYPDRVLFLATDFCSTYCRYCTRSRLVGHSCGCGSDRKRWDAALEYIARTPAVRDVIVSGGDPLTLPDDRIRYLLLGLRRIPHVQMVRIGTKVPAVLPQRITKSLVRMLREFHPLYVSLHFTHPAELTSETAQACERLADGGIPLGSQTVLLAGVNDELETMTQLFQGLLRIRVRPYYLYQCDPIRGSAHFRTPVKTGLDLISGLRGHTSGYAVPTYVIDAPGGGGKIPLLPDYARGHDGSDLLLSNYLGDPYRYPDPGHPGGRSRRDGRGDRTC